MVNSGEGVPCRVCTGRTTHRTTRVAAHNGRARAGDSTIAAAAQQLSSSRRGQQVSSARASLCMLAPYFCASPTQPDRLGCPVLEDSPRSTSTSMLTAAWGRPGARRAACGGVIGGLETSGFCSRGPHMHRVARAGQFLQAYDVVFRTFCSALLALSPMLAPAARHRPQLVCACADECRVCMSVSSTASATACARV